MTEDEFRESLAFGREQRNIEFKGPGPRTERDLLAKVVRAMLGMANKADGGYVIIGVKDDGQKLYPVGVSTSDIETWTYDDLASDMANYADPFLTFELNRLIIDGNTYAVVRVNEFEFTPVLCKRQYKDVLKNGACYVRSYQKMETIEVNSHILMRELIERATEIETRRELQRLQRLGLIRAAADLEVSPSDDERFDEQIRNLS
jgi:predicted HTH transcriptional regulator